MATTIEKAQRKAARRARKAMKYTACPTFCSEFGTPEIVPGVGHNHWSDELGGYVPALHSVEITSLTASDVPLVAACAFRDEVPGRPDAVDVHITSEAHDLNLKLTPFHARQLAHQLTVSADLVDGEPR